MNPARPFLLRNFQDAAAAPEGLLVTTAGNVRAGAVDVVRERAAQAGLPFVSRRDRSIAELFRTEPFRHLLVWPVQGQPSLHRRGGGLPLSYHPGMALVRIKRLCEDSRDDRLLALADVRPGDRILDCTAGLGSDAVVLSHAIGPQGSCTALEVRPEIAQLLAIGRVTYESGVPAFDTALRRLDVRCAPFRSALAVLPDDSYDIVYFDPMFDAPVEGSHSLQRMRDFAELSSVTQSDLAQALRVARRVVVVKGRGDSAWWREWRIPHVDRKSGKVAYGLLWRK